MKCRFVYVRIVSDHFKVGNKNFQEFAIPIAVVIKEELFRRLFQPFRRLCDVFCKFVAREIALAKATLEHGKPDDRSNGRRILSTSRSEICDISRMPTSQNLRDTFQEGSSRFLFGRTRSARVAPMCPGVSSVSLANRHGRLDLSHYYISLSYYTRCRFYLGAEHTPLRRLPFYHSTIPFHSSLLFSSTIYLLRSLEMSC